LSVNVAIIDTQHQKLVKMINELNDAMRVGKSKDVLGGIVQGLVAYAGVHFSTEERYFEQFQYPDTDAHKAEHSAFAAKASGFSQQYQQGKIGLSIELLDFLSDWLGTHIKGVDKKYSAFFNANGLK
jgi:hemerythrin